MTKDCWKDSSVFDLGRWAVVDIETTGVDPLYDDIIDVGFLQFEGTTLVREYRSLVRSETTLSYFIQKLTGIDQGLINRAPLWEVVEPEVMELFGHHLIAHNADFEKSFLQEHFDALGEGGEREKYEDSLPFLALLFPWKSHLKLESFLSDWSIRDGEVHRGLEDSIDLLKVLLTAVKCSREDVELKQTLNALFHKYDLKDNWYYKFFNLYDDQLDELARQIGFDLKESVTKALAFEQREKKRVPELIPSPFDLEFSGKNIQSILRSEDEVKKRIPFYQYRKTQEELSLKTGQGFKNKVHALVQAPTGTGKTLGYLLPSSLFALSERKQVLIATGTKTLQQQAIDKDVPQLRQLLSLDDNELKVRRLIGSQNHLCELLFRQSTDGEELLVQAKSFEEKFTDLFFEVVFFYNGRHEGENLILRDDLPFIFKAKHASFRQKDQAIAVDYRACTGQSCPYRHDCSYVRGLREAKDADIIIGNHALMFSWPRSFPKPEYIVVDEAHRIEEETTRAFSLEASQEGLENFARSLGNLQGLGSLFYLLAQNEMNEGDSSAVIADLREDALRTYRVLQDHLVGLPELVETYFKKRPKYTDQFWNELPMVSKESPTDTLGTSLFNHFESLKFALQNLANELLPYSTMFEAKDRDDENQIIAITRFETFLSSLDDLVLALDTACEKKPDRSHSLKYHESFGYSAVSAPINIGSLLHDQLLQTSSSVIYTSATLGNSDGLQGTKGIEWATGYAYLEPERRFRKGFFLSSDYDYENNTRVYLCDDTVPFYQSDFVESTLKSLTPLIRDLEGRTLLLFSARKRFEIAREVLLREFEGEIPVFVQGMGANVVEGFKKSGGGILLGMESFGEGIDIPGEDLQFVFIDKVPDLRMDLVINERRQFYEANLGNEFTDYYLAHRTRSLHQKLGRLMRRENDIGGVIIVDSRVQRWKGKTMEKVIKLMQPYRLRRSTLSEAIRGVRDFVFKSELEDKVTFEEIKKRSHLANDPYHDYSST